MGVADARSARDDDVHRQVDELRRRLAQALVEISPFDIARRSNFDPDVLAIDVAKITQGLAESVQAASVLRAGLLIEVSDTGHPGRRRGWHGEGAAAGLYEQPRRDE